MEKKGNKINNMKKIYVFIFIDMCVCAVCTCVRVWRVEAKYNKATSYGEKRREKKIVLEMAERLGRAACLLLLLPSLYERLESFGRFSTLCSGFSNEGEKRN